ncbi:MAG: hypothetical protein OEV42_19470 [Deltaproteobacteria bacterium]|nr:hypothetical protein [Deltaproteobacteria bacterium]
MSKKRICPTHNCGYETREEDHEYCPKCGNVLYYYPPLQTPHGVCGNHDICGPLDCFDKNICTGTHNSPNCVKAAIKQNEDLSFAIRQLRIGLSRMGWKAPGPEEMVEKCNGTGFDQPERETVQNYQANG